MGASFWLCMHSAKERKLMAAQQTNWSAPAVVRYPCLCINRHVLTPHTLSLLSPLVQTQLWSLQSHHATKRDGGEAVETRKREKGRREGKRKDIGRVE